MYSNTIDYSKPSDYYSKDDLIKMYNTDISEDNGKIWTIRREIDCIMLVLDNII